MSRHACITHRARRCFGVPVPDLSQLIPKEWDTIEHRFAQTLGLAPALLAKALEVADTHVMSHAAALGQDDAALVAAVQSGRLGSARMRPASLQGDELELLCKLFGMPDAPKVCGVCWCCGPDTTAVAGDWSAAARVDRQGGHAVWRAGHGDVAVQGPQAAGRQVYVASGCASL